MSNLNEAIDKEIRDVPDFPKPGILFKDITPLLANSALCKRIADEYAHYYSSKDIEVVAGVESRGFLFGMMLAERLGVPFVPIRKAGKLPYEKIEHAYDLEYGSATLEIHTDAIHPYTRVLLHDDLLATGGTAKASAELIRRVGGRVVSFFFLIELGFLEGRESLEEICDEVVSIIKY
jgi:adenine phosphoribosyltransferase